MRFYNIMAEALKHNLKVATHIRKAIAAGVSMKVILDDIQKYNGAPTSMNGMYTVSYTHLTLPTIYSV